MKTILALFALILIPAAALAADAKAAPTVYEDTWLKIKYYDVADVLKYEGSEKDLVRLKYLLHERANTKDKRYKITGGIVLLQPIAVTMKLVIKDTSIPKYSVLSKIGNTKIVNHKSIENFMRSAKPQDYTLMFYGLTAWRYNEQLGEKFIFTLKEKPAGYATN